MAFAGPYRASAPDRGADLESLIEPDALARSLSAHRRRVGIGIVVGTLTVLVLFCVSGAVEDYLAMQRFGATANEPLLRARPEMTVSTRVAALSSPAVREEDAKEKSAALGSCSTPPQGDPLAAESPAPWCLRFPAQPID